MAKYTNGPQVCTQTHFGPPNAKIINFVLKVFDLSLSSLISQHESTQAMKVTMDFACDGISGYLVWEKR